MIDFAQTRLLFRRFEHLDGANVVITATMQAIADDLAVNARAYAPITPVQRRSMIDEVVHELRLYAGDSQ